MRLVQVSIPAGKREQLLETLDDKGVDYLVTDETSGREYTGVVYFPLPTNAVEPVLDSLQEIGLDEEAYTVVVDAETVISRQFEALSEQYAEENGDEDRISRQELLANAEELMPAFSTFVVMTVVSAVVATAGLFLDSAAVVVGSMIIAPLLGPAIAASVGTVTADTDLFRRGLKLQVIGVLLAIAGATVFAFLVRTANLVPPNTDLVSIPQIRGRLSPDFLELAVALGAGIAGALSLSTGVSTAIVGALIAAALIPPIAIVGIGLAWWKPNVLIGSSVLVLVNLISINLAALAVLWYAGYRPENWRDTQRAEHTTTRRIAVLAASVLLLSVFLGGVTYSTYQQGTFEGDTNREIRTLITERYESLRVLDIEFQYTQVPFRRPEQVVVTVGRPADGNYPNLAERIKRRVLDNTDAPVKVQVRFVELQSA